MIGRELGGGGVMTGQVVRGGIGWAWASGGLRKRSEAECGAYAVLGGSGWLFSKGGERASMVALPQPAANGSLCGGGSELGSRSDDGVRLCGAASVGLGRRAGCANGAIGGRC